MNERSLWKLLVDGASKSNPGPAGVGIYITKDDIPVEKLGFFVGIKTNNQAEYLALILGLLYLKPCVKLEDLVLMQSDSELMVKQIKGLYKVKNEGLQPLYCCALRLLSQFQYDICHIPREFNKVADALANLGISESIRISDSVQAILHDYAISL